MAEKEVRKTTAKKTVRRSTTKVAPSKTPVRRSSETPVRRAPSRVAAPESRRRRSMKPLIGLIILLLIIGASAAIGYSDKGQIDVTKVIAERKQNASPEEQETFKTVPVQQGQTSAINGGLVGAGKSPLPPSNASPETETGTSSEEDVATTSEEAIIEETGEGDITETATSGENADPLPQ